MVDETKTMRPSAGKAKEGAGVDGPGNASYLEGLSASELTMIHRLAGNDPNVRKKTMRKLRKWLATIASKIPDTPESRDLVVPNFVRVWKALFYCMWMADKPLPQEQLAEQISNLLNIFARKQNIMIVFIDWFFLTVAREWSWIDRFRLDKFMMLIRRFLRKSLEQLSLRDWDKDILTQFVQIISNDIFNRHPATKKTRSRAKIPDHPRAPLGFQIHFTDIFLEELAKVGAETLESDATLELLSPFIFELAHNDDDRLLTEIRERIFIHLIKQSDAAFDYMEGGIESSDDEEGDEDEDEEEMDENNADDQDIEEEESDNEEMDYNQPLDPRAGQVDVILPQLQISYDKLAIQLVESGGQKGVKGKNKKILFALARSMNELTEGNYPLALPDPGPRAPAISKKEVIDATKRLASLHDELVADKAGKKRKKSALALPEYESGPSDIPVSKAELKTATKRPASPEDELTGNKTKKKKLTLASPETGATASGISTKEIKITPTAKRLSSQDNELTGNRIKKKMSPLASPVSSPKKSPAVAKKESGSSTPVSKKVSGPSLLVSPVTSPKKSPAITKKESGPNTPISKKQSGPITSISKNKSSPSTLPISPKKETPITNKQLSSLGDELGNKPKRVSFILARNSEHPHSDYQDSIQRSPAIPFDSKKQPNGGLLKARSPATPTLKGYVIPKRKKAADFF